MSALDRLATHLVAEVPVATLQELLRRPPHEIPIAGGGFCGGRCRPDGTGFVNGLLCGFGCRPALIAGAPSVVDPDGTLGLTAEDLTGIRNDLPVLRQAVIYEIEANLKALK